MSLEVFAQGYTTPDPDDRVVWDDPFHLNQDGHRLFADHIAARLTA